MSSTKAGTLDANDSSRVASGARSELYAYSAYKEAPVVGLLGARDFLLGVFNIESEKEEETIEKEKEEEELLYIS